MSGLIWLPVAFAILVLIWRTDAELHPEFSLFPHPSVDARRRRLRGI